MFTSIKYNIDSIISADQLFKAKPVLRERSITDQIQLRSDYASSSTKSIATLIRKKPYLIT